MVWIFSLLVWVILIPKKVESVVCPDTFSQALRDWIWAQLSTNRGDLCKVRGGQRSKLFPPNRENWELQDFFNISQIFFGVILQCGGISLGYFVCRVYEWGGFNRDFAAFEGASCCCPLALQKVMGLLPKDRHCKPYSPVKKKHWSGKKPELLQAEKKPSNSNLRFCGWSSSCSVLMLSSNLIPERLPPPVPCLV